MNQDKYHIDQIFPVPEDVSADQLLRYANDELSDEEAHRVERSLVDSEFHSDALEGIEMVGKEKFQAMMDKVNASINAKVAESHEEDARVIAFQPDHVEEIAPASPRKSRSLYRTFSIAASVVLLAVAGYFFLRPNVTPQDIATEYFEVFDGNVVRGGTQEATLNVYDTAKQLYNDKKYNEAAPLFDQVDSIQAQYYAANCYYALGQYDLAADRFSSVIAKGDGYAEDAEFGIAMTFLMQNNVEDARKMLQGMSQESRHNYSLKAKEALEKLESL
jgi:TolA-binding protein